MYCNIEFSGDISIEIDRLWRLRVEIVINRHAYETKRNQNIVGESHVQMYVYTERADLSKMNCKTKHHGRQEEMS